MFAERTAAALVLFRLVPGRPLSEDLVEALAIGLQLLGVLGVMDGAVEMQLRIPRLSGEALDEGDYLAAAAQPSNVEESGLPMRDVAAQPAEPAGAVVSLCVVGSRASSTPRSSDECPHWPHACPTQSSQCLSGCRSN